LYGAVNYHEEISSYILDNFVYQKTVVVPESGEWARNEEFIFVQPTTDFYPADKQDLYNVFYTILNNKWDQLTFYCGEDYDDCAQDLSAFTVDGNLLSIINNYAPVYNGFKNISVTTNNYGKIKIDVNYIYEDTDIQIIEAKVNSIYDKIIDANMSDRQKVIAAHDYIVNNSYYDNENAEIIISGSNVEYEFDSQTAYGPLLQGKAICSGYTDAMGIFLDRMELENYKVSTINHVWNVVELDGEWYHIDLTWDDPVLSNGKNMISHKYLLLTSEELESKNDGEHNYPDEVYLELEKES
jgi:hypothetical protein